MQKRTLLASVALAALLAACGKTEPAASTAPAAAPAPAPAAVVKLVVGLDDNVPPMGFRDEKNELVGFDIDMAREAARRMGTDIEFKDGKLVEVPGTEKHYQADLVLLAMGFVSPVAPVLDAFGVDKDARGNARATTDFDGGYATNVPKVFAAGDIRRGQSLVVWAIREGRQAARAVDEFLMGYSDLPR